MEDLKAYYYELKGTNYEAGRLIGAKLKATPKVLKMQIPPKSTFSKKEEKEISRMFKLDILFFCISKSINDLSK